VTAVAIVLAGAWIAAGLLLGVAYGVSDTPDAPAWAVFIVAWLPLPIAPAVVADVALREFGRRARSGTVPRAVGASLLLWAVAAVACVVS
jgi:hypothetical protein